MAKPNKRTKKSKKTVGKSVLCEQCGRKFSKPANLKAHIQKEHKGLRWRCPICHEEQVSKFSHERHFKTSHPDETLANPVANMRYSGILDFLPEKAKDSMIADLKKRNTVLEALFQSIRKRLLSKMKENMDLKAKLGFNIEAEKTEYNSMIVSSDTESGNDSNEDLPQEFKTSESESREKEESDDDDEEEIDDDDDEEKIEHLTKYPSQHSDNDPLKHITGSDPGAGTSKQ